MAISTNRKWILRSLGMIILTVASCFLGYVAAAVFDIVVASKLMSSDLSTTSTDYNLLIRTMLLALIVGICDASVGYVVLRNQLRSKAVPIFWLGTIAAAELCVLLVTLIQTQSWRPGSILPLIPAGIAGTLSGLIQWSQLREKPRLSLLWIPASALGWLIAMYLFLSIAAGMD